MAFSPGEKPVLVLGAAGGVGSVAVAILANLGYKVAAVTGKADQADYLKGLGATEIILREDHEVGARARSGNLCGCD